MDPTPTPGAPPRTPETGATPWHRQIPCPACGYSLTGHADPDLCPECGEDFRGLPGGVAWHAGERLRMACVAAGLLAVSLLVLASQRGPLGGTDLSRLFGNDQLAFLVRMFGAGSQAKLAYVGVFLAGVLLWTSAPRPRPTILHVALALCLLQPLLLLLTDLYTELLWSELSQSQARNSGGSRPGTDSGLFFLISAWQALLPITLWMLHQLVAGQLHATGLAGLADRLNAWLRPALFIIPTLVIADRALLYSLKQGPGGGLVLASGSFSPVGLGAFDGIVMLLGPLHGLLTTLLVLAVGFGATRLALRALWIIRADRPGTAQAA